MKIKTLLFPAFLLLFISCNKKDSTNPPQEDDYRTVTAGSTWNYHNIDSSGTTPVNKDYTITSTSRDTAINSRTYHIYSVSGGGFQYLNTSGSDYYQFDSLPAGFGTSQFERLYLIDIATLGISWTQTVSVTISGVPVPLTITYTIAEKDVSRTVNGIAYANVIHVTTAITSPLIPSTSLTTNINSYYAKKYGLIETTNIIHLNFGGIVQNVHTETKLVGAALL